MKDISELQGKLSLSKFLNQLTVNYLDYASIDIFGVIIILIILSLIFIYTNKSHFVKRLSEPDRVKIRIYLLFMFILCYVLFNLSETFQFIVTLIVNFVKLLFFSITSATNINSQIQYVNNTYQMSKIVQTSIDIPFWQYDAYLYTSNQQNYRHWVLHPLEFCIISFSTYTDALQQLFLNIVEISIHIFSIVGPMFACLFLIKIIENQMDSTRKKNEKT
jgi:hypothetical protein